MFNFTLISKKNFLSFLKNTNLILINIFNNLKLSNLKRLTKLFLIDKRVIFTLIIIFFSVFVHLSTPAFYKDSWVKEIVKNQFEKQFKFEIEFSDELSYAIFPIPHFRFKNVKFTSSERELAEIDSIKVYLTFSKFLDQYKMNIQNVIIKKGKFNLYKRDFINLIDFFNGKINEKKITIFSSKIFLKDDSDDIYSIISIDKSDSFYDNLETINKLNITGSIFNNSFDLKLKNNFVEQKSNIDLIFNKLNKRFINIVNFENKKIEGNLSFLDSRKKYDTTYSISKDILKFNSSEKIDNIPFYSGVINFSPFFSDIQINLKSIDLKNFIGNESLFLEILKSNIFVNENLNFNIAIKSKNILDHRKLKELNLNINYVNQLLNFDKSNFLLEDILKVNLIDSKFINSKKQYFLGKFEVLVEDHSKLYRFFQTKKKYRKKISSIYVTIKYNFLKNNLTMEEIIIDNKTNKNVLNFIKEFNQANTVIKNRVDLRNFFNSLIEGL